MFVGEHMGAADRDQCYVAGLGLHPVDRVLDHRPGAVEHRGGQGGRHFGERLVADRGDVRAVSTNRSAAEVAAGVPLRHREAHPRMPPPRAAPQSPPPPPQWPAVRRLRRRMGRLSMDRPPGASIMLSASNTQKSACHRDAAAPAKAFAVFTRTDSAVASSRCSCDRLGVEHSALSRTLGVQIAPVRF
jgi:hypothetical protein